MRAATPASILVLAATVILVFVTCSTPIIKSISFLEATIGGSGSEKGQVAKLGALGYCIGDSCAGPTIGYSFDPNQLLGINNPSAYGYTISTDKYTTAVIHGLTYALVLNPIALAACFITLITGILAHCGDFSLVCINSFFSGLASFITFVSAALNFALFIIARKRINAVNGASATLGIALWLSLAAWILIVLSSCAFCCGCGGRSGGGRSRRKEHSDDDDVWKAPSGRRQPSSYGERMRMDALEAESERKYRGDIPKFAVYETEHVEELPLTNDYDGVHGYQNGTHTPAGYAYSNQSPYAQSAGHGVAPAATYRDVDSGMAGFAAHHATTDTSSQQPYDQYSYVDYNGYADSATPNVPMPMPGSGGQDYFNQPQSYSHSPEQTPGQAYAYTTNDYNGAGAHQQQGSGAQLSSGYEHEQPAYGHQGNLSPSDAYRNTTSMRSPELQSDGFGGMVPKGSAVSSANASTGSPYDAVEQATAAGRARRLPEVPAGSQQEIPYQPSDSALRNRQLPVPGQGAQANESHSYGEAYDGVASTFGDHSTQPSHNNSRANLPDRKGYL